jgi:hypothetical protein
MMRQLHIELSAGRRSQDVTFSAVAHSRSTEPASTKAPYRRARPDGHIGVGKYCGLAGLPRLAWLNPRATPEAAVLVRRTRCERLGSVPRTCWRHRACRRPGRRPAQPREASTGERNDAAGHVHGHGSPTPSDF